MRREDWRALRVIWRTDGGRAVLQRLWFRFSRAHEFAVLGVALDAIAPPEAAPTDIELREIGIPELRALRKRRSDLTEYFFRNETEPLDRCWVAISNGQLGFICWLSYRGSSRMIRFSPRTVEIAYIYCMPELRGRRLNNHAIRVIAEQLRREGFGAFLTVVNRMNDPMIRSFESCGFRILRTIKRYGIVTWPWTPVAMDDPG
jgi:ribosomal protein S18 acetylase RimI-like enzyme